MQKSRNDPELQEWLDALTNIISEDGNEPHLSWAS